MALQEVIKRFATKIGIPTDKATEKDVLQQWQQV